MLAKGRNKHFTGQVQYLHIKESQMYFSFQNRKKIVNEMHIYI